MWEMAPKVSRRLALQRLFDKIHTVLAEEHLLAHEEGGCAEDAALYGGFRCGLQARLHVIALDQRLEIGGLQACAAQNRDKLRRIAEILRLAPHGVEHRVAVGHE